MKEKRGNNNFFENMEAVPGPAFVVEKTKWDEMQTNCTSQKTIKELKKYQPFFDKVKQNSKNKADNDLSI